MEHSVFQASTLFDDHYIHLVKRVKTIFHQSSISHSARVRENSKRYLWWAESNRRPVAGKYNNRYCFNFRRMVSGETKAIWTYYYVNIRVKFAARNVILKRSNFNCVCCPLSFLFRSFWVWTSFCISLWKNGMTIIL